MSAEDDKRRPLDVKSKEGALLEGTGHSISQIMAAVGVSESTVSRWRRNPNYGELVARVQEKNLERVEPLITRVKEGITSGAIEATNALRRMLNSEDEGVQTRAAELLLQNFKGLVAVEGAKPDGDDGPVGGNVNSLTLVIGQDQLQGRQIAARPGDIIESTAEELPAPTADA